MSPEPYSILVADDEAPARRRIIDLLRPLSEVGTIVEADNGDEALRLLTESRPDFAFLDVEMPGLSGLDIIARVGVERMPPTVFVTAYENHAIAAFDAAATDYLLKPVREARFAQAFDRLKAKLLWAGHPKARLPDRIIARTGSTAHFVEVRDIEWIEGAGVYVVVHAGGREILHRGSLTALASSLSASGFVRVHRSAVVNPAKISHVAHLTHGDLEATLASGAKIKISRKFRALMDTATWKAIPPG